jgi:hypothetical protein
MNKIQTCLGLSSVLVLSSFSALASDTQATDISVGMAVDQGLSAVLELDNQYRFTLGNDGGAFDYIVKGGQFDANTPVSWYVGVGGWSEWEGKSFGARVPLGLKWDLTKGWNMYGQVHPELDLYSGAKLKIGGALGIKYTF